MPQMNPSNWLILIFFFNLILFVVLMKSHFFLKPAFFSPGGGFGNKTKHNFLIKL